jgi:hypothetical protein
VVDKLCPTLLTVGEKVYACQFLLLEDDNRRIVLSFAQLLSL